MSKAEEQILLNQIMIMEALITIFHQSNDNNAACRNLMLQADATYKLLKKNRSENEHGGTNQGN